MIHVRTKSELEILRNEVTVLEKTSELKKESDIKEIILKVKTKLERIQE